MFKRSEPAIGHAAAAALAEPGVQPASLRETAARDRLVARLKAAAIHLLLSVIVAAAVLALVYGAWYRPPLAAVSGVGTILMLLLSVDVVLGPLLTAIVFDRRKKSLPFDLACIAALQLAALAYGLYTVEAGRPHYLVFTKDRFEVVARADLAAEDLARASAAARPSLLGPVIVAAIAPQDPEARRLMMFEAAGGGRDLQHYPQHYQPYDAHRAGVLARARPLAALEAFNPDRFDAVQAEIDTVVRRAGLARDQARFLPVRGPEDDVVMLVDGRDGAIVGLVAARPW